MKHFLSVATFIIFLTFTQTAFSQFTPGLRLAGYSSMGVGPFFNIESKRVLMQLSFVKYFTTYSTEFHSSFDNESIKVKPHELSMIFGYKINANKPVKFYPFVGFRGYYIGQVRKTNYNNSTTTVREKYSFYDGSLGLGAYYNFLGKLIFDLQTKLVIIAGDSPSISLGMGIGYKLSKEQ